MMEVVATKGVNFGYFHTRYPLKITGVPEMPLPTPRKKKSLFFFWGVEKLEIFGMRCSSHMGFATRQCVGHCREEVKKF